ncbi:MAG: PBP1A family penicillin-binding protein [Clostridia bacterium]|nr:PBP1A family penicillin-binding protein [Clostridia bacterium]
MARNPETRQRGRTPGRRRGKRSGKQIAKLILKIILISILVVCLVVGGYVAYIVSTVDFSIGDSMSMLNMNLTSIVYWQNPDTGEWEEYEYLSSESNRIWADIDTIPNYLEDAFIAIEDQRFMSHHGVDWKRTIGATFNELFGGGSTYGGSSITQQLVKNMTGEKDRSYDRKIKEIVRALAIERKMSKQQILELYLNSIYLGQGCYGVESASQIYFNKSVSELTLAEAASIAGITQYPALYDPFINPEKNIEKQRTVLYKMLELGYITQEEYDAAIAEELHFVRGEVRNGVSQSYFVDQVVEDVIADLCANGYSEAIATQMVYNGGLKIYATVDRDVQARAEYVFENEDNFPTISGNEQPQGAIVVTEPSTGYIKAIVGGRGEKNLSRGLNRATQTTRQPGSTIKPLSVYGPAIDMGIISPDSIIEDEPLDIGGWSPKNHYSGYYGEMTIRRAVNISANTPAVRVLQKLTIDNSYNYMTNRLNFTTLVDSEKRNDGRVYSDKNLPALALGGLTDGVTVKEMTAAYATFANGGEYIEPITYLRVEDNAGKVVLDKTQGTNKQRRQTAFTPATAYQMNKLLNGVVTSGTAAGSSIPGIETAGKTGTTDGDTDRWFAGYTPYYSAVVWVGMDSGKMPSFSSNPALALWKKVMVNIHEDLPNKSFDMPSGMSSVSVCYVTGMLASADCYDEEGVSTAVVRYYDSNNLPQVYCDGAHGVKPTEGGEGEPTEGEEGETPSDVGNSGENAPEDGSNTPATETVPEAPPENITE